MAKSKMNTMWQRPDTGLASIEQFDLLNRLGEIEVEDEDSFFVAACRKRLPAMFKAAEREI